ncbi:MAG: 3-isopropylmalate dehydratase small subunit [Pseudomonadota bacterium]
MSKPLVRHQGVAAILMRDNVDTDQIIPSREMKSVSRDGLADGLFAGWRYTAPGSRVPNPDFVLNRPATHAASILVGGENFGCGSSREHAVWALKEYGFQVVIAKSFGEIFHGNCIRNGILPIALPARQVERLAMAPAPVKLQVDLEQQTLISSQDPDRLISFEIGAFAKRLLMDGLDPIALTMTQQDQIETFFSDDAARRPWVYSAG